MRLAFFDTKPYDRLYFDKWSNGYEIEYFEGRLTPRTAGLTAGFDAVCAFVNDEINAQVIDVLYQNHIGVLVMRCAGYSNVDLRAAQSKIKVLRVPAYSPFAVAEHAMALLLTLNRKLHKAYFRTRDFNFNITGLTGMDLHGKTVGVIGTGRIGQEFIHICQGFGMKILAFDKFPNYDLGVNYVNLDRLFRESDVISLHCPLTKETYHLLDHNAFSIMKDGAFVINTSRGALIDSGALLEALNSGKLGGAGLDVYEEEAGIFYEDRSQSAVKDEILSLLLTRPNVLITSHQAFLTWEALENIAKVTLQNLDDYFAGKALKNEVALPREHLRA